MENCRKTAAAAAVLGVADCAKAADGAADAKKSDVAVEDAEVKENAILFKIHDIVPVKNSDDEGKSKNSIKPFIVINSVMLVLILITFACWRFGCVEHRNNSVSAVTVSDSATPSEYN